MLQLDEHCEIHPAPGKYLPDPLPVADPGFPQGGSANSKDRCEKLSFDQFFPKNCMKLKEFGPTGGVPDDSPLDPPVVAFHR